MECLAKEKYISQKVGSKISVLVLHYPGFSTTLIGLLISLRKGLADLLAKNVTEHDVAHRDKNAKCYTVGFLGQQRMTLFSFEVT